MDLTIDLGLTEGSAPELYKLALARLGEALGEPIVDRNEGIFLVGQPRTLDGFGPYPTIELDSSSGKAPDLFDQILERAGGQEAYWTLSYVVWHVPDEPDGEYWSFMWWHDAPVERHVRDVP